MWSIYYVENIYTEWVNVSKGFLLMALAVNDCIGTAKHYLFYNIN